MSKRFHTRSKQRKYREKKERYLSFFEKLNCFYCRRRVYKNTDGGKNAENTLTIDHLNPLNKGGDLFDFNNFRICCDYCNCARDKVQAFVNKHNKVKLEKFLLKLSKRKLRASFFYFIMIEPPRKIVPPHIKLKGFLKYLEIIPLELKEKLLSY